MFFLFFLQLLSETVLILRRTERDMIKNAYLSSLNVPVVIASFKLNSKFLDRILKNVKISNCIKISPLGAELYHADGRTDGTKLTVAFRSFATPL